MISNSISSKSSFQDLVQVVTNPPSLPIDTMVGEDGADAGSSSPGPIEPSLGWKQHWQEKGILPSDDMSMDMETSSLSSSSSSSSPAPALEDLSVRDLANFQGWEWGYAIWDYQVMHRGVELY